MHKTRSFQIDYTSNVAITTYFFPKQTKKYVVQITPTIHIFSALHTIRYSCYTFFVSFLKKTFLFSHSAVSIERVILILSDMAGIIQPPKESCMPSKEYYYSTIVDVLPFNSAEISLIENYYDSQLLMEYLPNIPKIVFWRDFFPKKFLIFKKCCKIRM